MTETINPPMRPPSAAADPDIQEHPVGAPERWGRALLGWVQEPDLRPLFQASAVTSPMSVDDFISEARVRRQARAGLTVNAPGSVTVAELPAPLAARADSLRATEQFRTHYEPFSAQLAVIPLADLVTPQWWVDAEYVDSLAESAPVEEDLDGMFDFSFSMGRLARPMNIGLNGAAFASARGDIGGPSPLRVSRYSPEKVTFEFDVTPRPNWVWVVVSADMNRLFILNGVHHLLALMKAGRQHAYCLVRPANSLGDLTANGWNPQNPELFKPQELTGPRPPLLRDYLDQQQAADVGIHLRQCFLRLALQAEVGLIPRVA